MFAACITPKVIAKRLANNLCWAASDGEVRKIGNNLVKEFAVDLECHRNRVLCMPRSFWEKGNAIDIDLQQNVSQTADTFKLDGALTGRH